jgi:hypothetical protein
MLAACNEVPSIVGVISYTSSEGYKYLGCLLIHFESKQNKVVNQVISLYFV